MLIDSLVALSPEIMLSIYSMVVVMVGVFSKTKSMDVSLLWLSCLMFCFISLIIALTEPSDIYAFNGAFKFKTDAKTSGLSRDKESFVDTWNIAVSEDGQEMLYEYTVIGPDGVTLTATAKLKRMG